MFLGLRRNAKLGDKLGVAEGHSQIAIMGAIMWLHSMHGNPSPSGVAPSHNLNPSSLQTLQNNSRIF